MKYSNLAYQFLLIFVVLLSACQQDDEVAAGQLSVNLTANNSLLNLPEGGEYSIMIDVSDANDNVVLEDRKFDLIKTSSNSEPILLPVGDYSISELVVLNANDLVVYASPKAGSLFENLVEHALPFEFQIASNEVMNITLDVISTTSASLEDLGYSSINLNVVNTETIFLSVFKLDAEMEKLNFVASEVILYAGTEELYNQALEASIQGVVVPLEKDTLHFKVSVSGYKDQIIGIGKAEIEKFSKTPLEVVFSPDNYGLKAHYLLDGNAKDNLGSYDGVVLGAIAGLDQFGNSNGAMFFNGTGEYISLEHKFDFENRTVAMSFKVDAIEEGSPQTIFGFDYPDLEYGGMNITLRNIDGQVKLVTNSGMTLESMDTIDINTNEWYHVAVSASLAVSKSYLNGQVFSEIPRAFNHSKDGASGTTLGTTRKRDRFLNGYINDVRIYDIALSTSAIQRLVDDQVGK